MINFDDINNDFSNAEMIKHEESTYTLQDRINSIISGEFEVRDGKFGKFINIDKNILGINVSKHNKDKFYIEINKNISNEKIYINLNNDSKEEIINAVKLKFNS